MTPFTSPELELCSIAQTFNQSDKVHFFGFGFGLLGLDNCFYDHRFTVNGKLVILSF